MSYFYKIKESKIEMSKGQGMDFFTKWDGYAQGVNLMYQNKTRF